MVAAFIVALAIIGGLVLWVRADAEGRRTAERERILAIADRDSAETDLQTTEAELVETKRAYRAEVDGLRKALERARIRLIDEAPDTPEGRAALNDIASELEAAMAKGFGS